jgi:transposase
MATTSYIGADVDSKTVDMAVERKQRIVKRLRVKLSIPELRDALLSIPGPRELTFEEGPMAHWLYRNLKDCVDRLVVCDPRRNGLIACDGDSDDPIDAGKLAGLLRGGFLRPVHHSDDDAHVDFKQWVALYYDRTQDAVRQINKIRARCKMHGLHPARGSVRNVAVRRKWLAGLGDHPGAAQLVMLWEGYDACRLQAQQSRRQMQRRAGKYPIIAAWKDLPGMGPIRSATLHAYLETPWRFGGNSRKLWKYCGVGLERSGSGKDKQGKPRVGHLQLAWQVNRVLKSAVMGAAISAIRQGDNVFAQQYHRLLGQGTTAGNARHAVARKMLTVMWGMWKSQTRYDPGWVLGPAGSPRRPVGPTPCAEAVPSSRPAATARPKEAQTIR